jgi:hypothetical protein
MPPLDTGLDASSAHGAALAQVAPWPHARAFFCPTAFAHCRPFKPYCVTEAAVAFISVEAGDLFVALVICSWTGKYRSPV